MDHPLGRFALLHPFPSLLVAALTATIALIAGAPGPLPLVLGLAMLGFQASIGTLNDLADAPHDRLVKPWKPIAAGRISRRSGALIVAATWAAGVAGSWWVSPLALALGLAGWGCGAAYDVDLKRRGLGWLAFAAAFPLLILYAWTGPTGRLPPGWPALLPLAALAGPTLALANALADLDDDRSTGARVISPRLGRDRALRLLAGLLTVTFGLAWLTLTLIDPPAPSIALAVGASGLAGVGLALLARNGRAPGVMGWSLVAVGMALFALAWVLAAAAGSGARA